MPVIPALREPLGDDAVALRPYAERDIPEILIAYQDDPHLHVRIGLDRPPSGAQLGTEAENAEADREAGRRLRLTILESGSDICRGRLDVHQLDWAHLRTELGIWLAPDVRGRGFSTRALRLIAPWLFGACGLARIELLVAPDNEPMLRAASHGRFVREGVLRGYQRQRNRRLDMAVLSLLPSDLQA